jgi:hypothetical protein
VNCPAGRAKWEFAQSVGVIGFTISNMLRDCVLPDGRGRSFPNGLSGTAARRFRRKRLPLEPRGLVGDAEEFMGDPPEFAAVSGPCGVRSSAPLDTDNALRLLYG